MKRTIFLNLALVLVTAAFAPAATGFGSGGLQPIAEAGLCRYAAKAPVVLDGTDSYGADGCGPLAYQWRQISGPSVVIADSNTPSPTISGFIQTDEIQTCEFELTVSCGGLTSVPDIAEVVIVPHFGKSILRLENDSFDPNKPTIIYFGGGDGVNGLPVYAEPPWNASVWNSRANIISFPDGYEADANPTGWHTYHGCGGMIITYLSSVAPNYSQPIHSIGWSTGGAPAVDVASYLNLTYRDARYAVNRVTGLDAAGPSASDRASQYLSSSVDGEQCWLDSYLSIFTSFVTDILGVAFQVSDHSLPPNWYGNSLTNPDASKFNNGVVAGAYWSVIGPGKNLQLASTPGRNIYRFKWYGSASSGYMDFYDQSSYPGRLPEPVQLVEPVNVGDCNGAILTCEESENAVSYQLLFGADQYRVMDYNIISDTPTPPNEIITTLPFEETWWTVKARDQYGSTIYADPIYINAFILSLPIENLTTGKRYGYIQHAINDAASGDEIVVREGIYLANINFKGKNLTVRSTDPNDPAVVAATVINGGNRASVVTFSNGEDANCVLSGFTITRGNAERGGGIYCRSDSSPTITNCIITNNSAGYGGGMYNWSGSPTLTNCTFSGNSAENGGGMGNSHSSPTVTHCTFSGNAAVTYGGGMYNWSSSPMLTNCIFSGNAAKNGGGMYNAASSPTLTNCTFSGNTARYGGGIYCKAPPPPPPSLLPPEIANGTTAENADTGIYYDSGGDNIIITNCILWGNEALDGPQIYLEPNSDVSVSYSDVQGGWPGEGNIDADPCFVEPGSWELIEGKVSYWKFDEGGGTTAYDSAGNYDGTVYGATWTTGQISGALSFDGVDDYVRTANNVFTNAQLASGATLSAWFKTDSTTYGYIADNEGYLTLGVNHIYAANPNKLCGIVDGGHHRFFSSSDVTDNLWHHAVIVWDGTNTAILYLDGVNVSSGFSGPPTPDRKSRPFAIGAHSTIAAYFNGLIDDVRIYDRALSGEEIQQLYHIGLTGHNDYHLLPDSPCINAGDPDYVAGPNETDLDGKPRVIGGRIDMGAYEFNHIPVACIVDGNQVVEAKAPWGARVTLDGSGSSDSDSTPGTNDDIVCFDWYKVDACDPNFEDFLASGEIIDCNLPLGEHIIVLEVIDKADAFDTNEVTIIVQDTTPPELTLSVTPTTLWPANHKMVLITPSWTASDICDASPEVSLVSITMNEDDEAKGDGHTTLNIQIGDDGSIYLRAERSGTGSGRIYTITYQAVDDSGNVAVASATVTVPHDQR